MGKKSPPPSPPDLKPLSDAQVQMSKEQAEIAREQLGLSRAQFEWFQKNAADELALAREQSDRLMGLQREALDSGKAAQAYAQQVGDKQMSAMDQQMGYAAADRQRYENVFVPLHDQLIAEAQGYDTPQRREAEAARAMADVQRQAEAQRANADASLRSMGIDPSQTRSTSLKNQMTVATAAQQAQAANAQRQQVENTGRQLRYGVVGLGQNLPGQSQNNYASAGNAGQGAIQAGAAQQQAGLGGIQAGMGLASGALGMRSGALGQMAQLTGSPMQWAQMGSGNYGQANNGYTSAGNMMNSGYQNQFNAWQAKQNQSQQGIGNILSVGSMATGMFMADGGSVADAMQIQRAQFDQPQLDMGGYQPAPMQLQNNIGAPQQGWRQKLQERMDQRFARGNDFIRPAEGQALSMGDRVHNGQVALRQARAAQPEAPTYQWAKPMPMMAEGGALPTQPQAQKVVPVPQSRDTVDVKLTPGEYVLPADVVRSVGIEKLDKMVAKYHRANS